jgi:hypothetical protein
MTIAPRPNDFYQRMIALCIGCTISFVRDYETDPDKRVALARRIGRLMVTMTKEAAQ